MTKKTSFDWRYLAVAAVALCLLSLTTTAIAGPTAPACCVCSCSNGFHCFQAIGVPDCPATCDEIANTTCSDSQAFNETLCETIPACAAGGTNPAAAPTMSVGVLALTAVLLSILGIWRARRRQS